MDDISEVIYAFLEDLIKAIKLSRKIVFGNARCFDNKKRSK